MMKNNDRKNIILLLSLICLLFFVFMFLVLKYEIDHKKVSTASASQGDFTDTMFEDEVFLMEKFHVVYSVSDNDLIVEVSYNWENVFSKIEIVTECLQKDDCRIVEFDYNDQFIIEDLYLGCNYLVKVTAFPIDENQKEVVLFEKTILVVDENRLENIPTVFINTKDEMLPSYTEAEKPDGAWGWSIDNNDYVECDFSMRVQGEEKLYSKGKIRVRGNTSAAEEKQPFKLKLKNPLDLLENGESDDEWLLLRSGASTSTFYGTYISNYCGLYYQPEIRFINLVINNEWKGCYLISEPVKKGENHVDISDDGVLIENDAYWWKTDKYFKTENQIDALGFTFKYPSDPDEYTIDRVHEIVQNIENKIVYRDLNYFNDIDAESFAKWILAHDILGHGDVGGSNMYFFIDDIYADNPVLSMGPSWDFDASFSYADSWSEMRYWSGVYSNYMMTMVEFYQLYVEEYDKIRDSFVEDLTCYVDDFLSEYGEGLQYSWEIDAEIYGRGNRSVIREFNQRVEWLEKRMEWMNNELH